MAKLFASDTAMRVATDAVQVLGGYGYVEDFPAERYLREAKVLQIVEGTNQIQRLVIGRSLARAKRLASAATGVRLAGLRRRLAWPRLGAPPCGLRAADGEPARGVEELQVGRVHRKLDRLAGADLAARGHPGRPQRLAAASTTAASSSSPSAAEVADRGVLHRGASMVKITWISLPSASMHIAARDIRAETVSASCASSKSDGRTPRITLRPK